MPLVLNADMHNKHYGDQNGTFSLLDKSALIRWGEKDPLGTRGTTFSFFLIFPDQKIRIKMQRFLRCRQSHLYSNISLFLLISHVEASHFKEIDFSQVTVISFSDTDRWQLLGDSNLHPPQSHMTELYIRKILQSQQIDSSYEDFFVGAIRIHKVT